MEHWIRVDGRLCHLPSHKVASQDKWMRRQFARDRERARELAREVRS